MPFLVVAVLYIIVEGYVLFWAADMIGALRVFLALGASALIGFYLVRSHGLNAFNRANQALARGESPHVEMLDGIVLLLCGIILIIPGFVSDVLVLPMLIPAFRKTVVRRMSARMGRMAQPGYPNSFGSQVNNGEFGGQGGSANYSGNRHGPFVFYRFFMSGSAPRQEPEEYKEIKNDYFEEFDSSEIIDVTPKQLGGQKSDISGTAPDGPANSAGPDDGDDKK